MAFLYSNIIHVLIRLPEMLAPSSNIEKTFKYPVICLWLKKVSQLYQGDPYSVQAFTKPTIESWEYPRIDAVIRATCRPILSKGKRTL